MMARDGRLQSSPTAGYRSPTHATSTPDGPLGLTLLDTPIVLWRSPDGGLSAARDQCPHRGAALSLGELRGDTLMCPYHGWRYDGGGHCVLPAGDAGADPAPERAPRDVRRVGALRRRLRRPRRAARRNRRPTSRSGTSPACATTTTSRSSCTPAVRASSRTSSTWPTSRSSIPKCSAPSRIRRCATTR